MLLIALSAGCAETARQDMAHEESPHARTLDDIVNHPAKPEAKAKAKAETKTEAKADAPPAAAHAQAGLEPLDALARLSAGNARFATGHRTRSADSTDDAAERATTAKGQHPFAVVLTCADSRVSPELVFDLSLGDLFVVRNAGNIAEPIGAGSIEYAIEHLGTRLIIVMGHASCGAVKAVSGAEAALPGHLADIQRAMPGLHDFALERGKAGRTPDAVIADAVEHNAEAQAIALIAGSEVIRHAVSTGQVAVLSAVYDLERGVVGFQAPVLPPSAGH